MKNRLLYLISLVTLLVGTFSAAFPVTSNAAVNTDNAIIQKEAVLACAANNGFSASESTKYSKTEQGAACVDAFTHVYKTPSLGAGNAYCDGKSGSAQGGCLQGITLAKSVRATDAKTNNSAGGSQTDTPSDKTLADQANSGGTCAKSNSSCVGGYIAGYKGTPKETDACKQGVTISGYKISNVNDCKTAYQAGAQESKGTKTPVAGSGAAVKAATGVSQDTGSSAEDKCKGSGFDAKLCCEYGNNPLNWVLCPLVNGMVEVVSVVDDIITAQLTIETNPIFGDDNGNCAKGDTCFAYKTAWRSFRNIALGLMVITGLIIVISQALGIELLDAYTIRKTLPKLLIAAVGITLSWPLMQFLVQLTNDLGLGIRHLIYAPFTSLRDAIDLSFGGNISNLIFGSLGFAGGVAAGAGVLLFGGMGLLTYAGTAMLAVFIALMVLVLRQIVVIMLIILAPIGIVAYILPNTQKLYKLWWESFSKALIMFPLISAFIAAGRVFSAISVNTGGPLYQLVGFIAYVAPYFMIPLTLKFAGNILGQLGGFVNSRGSVGFGALGKIRSNQFKKNTAAMKAGTRVEGKRWIPGSIKAADKFNEASKGVATGWNGRFGLGKRGVIARRYADQVAADAAHETPGMKAIAGYNNANRVLAMGMGDERLGREKLMQHLMMSKAEGGEGMSQTDARTEVDKATRSAKVAGGFTKANGIAAFKNMVIDGTAVRNVDDLTDLAARAGQGDRNNTFNYAAWGASTSKKVGRHDLGTAADPIGALAFKKSDRIFNNGNPALSKEGADEEALSYEANKSAMGGGVGFTVLGGDKGRSVEKAGNFWSSVISDTTGKYTDEQKLDAAVYFYNQKRDIDQAVGHQNNRDRSAAAMSGGDAAYGALMADPNVKALVAQRAGPSFRDRSPQEQQAMIDAQNAAQDES